MSMSKRDKERQLQELTMIVTGIRLFNKECGKGGEGIDDRKYNEAPLFCHKKLLDMPFLTHFLCITECEEIRARAGVTIFLIFYK